MSTETLMYGAFIIIGIFLLIKIASKVFRIAVFGLILVFAYQMYVSNMNVDSAIDKVKSTIGVYTGVAKTAYTFAENTGKNFEFKDGKFAIKSDGGKTIVSGDNKKAEGTISKDPAEKNTLLEFIKTYINDKTAMDKVEYLVKNNKDGVVETSDSVITVKDGKMSIVKK
jgi:uncharacterized membrane protein